MNVPFLLSQLFRNIGKRIFYFFNWIYFLLLQKGGSLVELGVRFNNPRAIRLGANSSINAGTFFDTRQGTVDIAANVKIGDHCRFTTANSQHKILIGEGTSIHGSCHFAGEVEIGNGCLLARNIFLSSSTHNFKSAVATIRQQDTNPLSQKVVIEDDVWLGWGAVVVPGVRIAKGSIIGANAVVTKNTEPFGVYAGVPAVLISRREPVQN